MLSKLGAIGSAVVDDFVVAQRLAHVVHVGGVLQAVVGVEVDTLRLEVIDTVLQGLSSQRIGLVAGQSLVVDGPGSGVKSGAIEPGVGVLSAALLDEHDVTLLQYAAQQFRIEDTQKAGADLRLARTAGQHEQGRIGGSLARVEAGDAQLHLAAALVAMQFRHHHVAAVHVKREINVLWQLGKALIQRLKARQGSLPGLSRLFSPRRKGGDRGHDQAADVALGRVAPQHDGHVLVRDDSTVALKAQRLAAVAQHAVVVQHAVRINGAWSESIHARRGMLLHQIKGCGIGEQLAGE